MIAPEGPAGDRRLALIAPLRQWREQQQGAPARVFRVPPDLAGAQAVRWKNTVLRDESIPEWEWPRYLLVLGGLEQVSLELQQALGSDAFVDGSPSTTSGSWPPFIAELPQAALANPNGAWPLSPMWTWRGAMASRTWTPGGAAVPRVSSACCASPPRPTWNSPCSRSGRSRSGPPGEAGRTALAARSRSGGRG